MMSESVTGEGMVSDLSSYLSEFKEPGFPKSEVPETDPCGSVSLDQWHRPVLCGSDHQAVLLPVQRWGDTYGGGC